MKKSHTTSAKNIIGYFKNEDELDSYIADEMIQLVSQKSILFVFENNKELNQLKHFLLQNNLSLNDSSINFILLNEISSLSYDYIFIVNTFLSKEAYLKLHSLANKKIYLITDDRLFINKSVVHEKDILEIIGSPADLTSMCLNNKIFPFS